MNDEILYWLALLGFILLRRFFGKRRQATAPKPSTISPEGKLAANPTLGEPVRSREIEAPAIAAQPPTSELEQALSEFRSVFGFKTAESDRPAEAEGTHRDVEAFGESEERFERSATFRAYPDSSEEKFESRSISFVSESDKEDAFERNTAFGSKAAFYDDGFEKMPASSEVDFRGTWKGHESDFEYHSALESRPSKIVRPTPAAGPAPVKEASYLEKRLALSSDLQKAVVMHEVLGLPVSLRPRTPRRHPS